MIKHVFVVDDDRVIASTTAAIMQLSGYDARCFVDPLEALEAASRSAPDLLIADVIMPWLSGIDLAIHFKKLCPTCKILLITSQAGTADLLEVARKQGHDFQLLTKPCQPTALLARIKDTAA